METAEQQDVAQAPETEAPASEKAESTGVYVVLVLNTITNEWRVLGEGASARDVIGDQEGTFLQVPKRSWHPFTREVETVQRTRVRPA